MLNMIIGIFDISIKDLSYFTKIPASTLSSYNSELSIPTKENLEKLCNFFGLSKEFFTVKGYIKNSEYDQIWEAKQSFVSNNFKRTDDEKLLKISDILNKRKEIMDKIDVLNSKHMEYINKILYCLDNQEDSKCKELLNLFDDIKPNNEDFNVVYQEYIYRVKDKDLDKIREKKSEIQELLKQSDYNSNKLMLIKFNKKIDNYMKGYYFYVDGCEHSGWRIVNRLNNIVTDKFDLEHKFIINVNWQHNNKFSDRITLFKDSKNDYAEILEDWSVN